MIIVYRYVSMSLRLKILLIKWVRMGLSRLYLSKLVVIVVKREMDLGLKELLR